MIFYNIRTGTSQPVTMVNKKMLLHSLLFLLFVNSSNGALRYHPLVIIHGVLTGSDSMEQISNHIQEVGQLK